MLQKFLFIFFLNFSEYFREYRDTVKVICNKITAVEGGEALYRFLFSALACVTVLLRPFQSVIPPAGSAPDRLQTTACPVPPYPACTKAAASPSARRDSSSRTTSAKVRDRAHIHARASNVPLLIYKCNKNLHVT